MRGGSAQPRDAMPDQTTKPQDSQDPVVGETPPGAPGAPQWPPDPVPLVIPGGGISLLAAASGTGKTAFLASVLKRLAAGQPLFGHPVQTPAKIVVLSIDRSWVKSTGIWFERAEYTPAGIYALQDDRSFPKGKLRKREHRTGIFKECLAKLGHLPYGTVLVVDTITPFLGGNINDYDSCMVACSEIREICLDYGLTLIGTSHSSKQKNDKRERYLRLQDRIAGTMAQFGYTDTQMYLASPEECGEEDTGHYTFLWHPHLAPAETFKFTRGKDGLFLIDPQAVTIPEGDFLPDAKDYPWLPALMELLKGETKTLDILEHLDEWVVSRATLFRILAKLEKKGIIRQNGHGIWIKAPVQ